MADAQPGVVRCRPRGATIPVVNSGTAAVGQASTVNPSDFLQQLMDVEDVARLLKVRPSTVRAYAERGTLSCVRLGNRLRFRPSDVGLWIARRFEKGGA